MKPSILLDRLGGIWIYKDEENYMHVCNGDLEQAEAMACILGISVINDSDGYFFCV